MQLNVLDNIFKTIFSQGLEHLRQTIMTNKMPTGGGVSFETSRQTLTEVLSKHICVAAAKMMAMPCNPQRGQFIE